ncbi:MAG TPA: polysaccharide biosynthesis tyrosine autokinase [Candidatus Polarisedimenticolaceae bacterium]
MDPSARQRHLLEYWAVLRRRRWIVYLGVAVVGLASLVGSFLVTPLYRATATVQIERQSPDILTFQDIAKVDYSFAAYSDFYQTQYKILTSEAVSRRTVERARLAAHPDFRPKGSPGLLARLRSLLPTTGPKVASDPIDIAAARVRARLEVVPVRNSHLVQVSWVSDDPALAATVANAAAEAYIAFNLESGYTASDQASEFLVDQIGQLKKEIDVLERELQSYGESKRIVSVDDASNITMRALADVAERRTQARAVLAEKEAAWTAVRSTPDEALPETLRSDLIARLRQDRASLEAEIAQKGKTFKDDWPGMVTLRGKLEQTEARLASETAAIARSVRLNLEAEYRRARAEVENLDALLSRQEGDAQQLKRDAVEFTNLQGEARKKRDTLNALIARQNEMALSTRLQSLDATSSNVKIVDRARAPLAPFRPNRLLNTLVGLLLGASLGIAAAFFLDYLDNTVASAAEVDRLVHLPVLATIPRHGDPSSARVVSMRRTAAAGPVAPPGPVDLVVHRDRRAPVSEAYRELRTAILLSNAGRPPRRIVVTSALPEEGKSATAINLAIVLAQLSRRVVLVDTDLRRPRLHHAFDVDNARGMSTFLSGLEDDPKGLVRETAIEHLGIVPSGPIPPNPSELLNGERFAGFANALVDAGWEHVIFDSPPVLSVADPVILGHASDGVVLVARAHRTPRESLRLAVERFAQAGVKPFGVVLNDVDEHVHGYRYYRYYGRSEADDDAASPPSERRSAG